MALLKRIADELRWWRALPHFLRVMYRKIEELDARMSEFETNDREHV